MKMKQVQQLKVQLLRDWNGRKAEDVIEVYPGVADCLVRFGHGRILNQRPAADGGQVDHPVSNDSGTAAAERSEKASRNRRR